MNETRLIVVMGTGQCGLPGVVEVFSKQPDCAAVYQALPLLPWEAADSSQLLERRIKRLLREAGEARFMVDAAPSYLPHIETLLQLKPDTKVICLRRPQEEVVRGFGEWLKRNYPQPTNHWAKTLKPGWQRDPVWSRMYPKYDIDTLPGCVAQYCDDYNREATALAGRFPNNVRIFESSQLDTPDGQRQLLTFAGIPESEQQPVAGSFCSQLDLDLNRPRPQAKRSERNQPQDPSRCVILVPYQSHIVPHCDESLRELERKGYPVRRVVGFAAIDQGRNQLATDALMDGFEELMWIDSDVGFKPEDVDRLRAHNLPICSAIYPQKGKPAIASHVIPGTETMTFGKEGGLHEILFAATGFLHARREVYQAVQERLDLPVCNERFGNPMIPFFQPLVKENDDGMWYLAEDYSFSHRVRQAGYKIMADTSIRLWHYGNYAYSWEEAGRKPERFGTYTLNFKPKPGQSNNDSSGQE